MEFWGIEVKSGQSFDVSLGEGKVLHLSQACLGETKKETKESACLHMTVDGKKLVLGTLIPEKLPQQLFDLVFDKDFQISHSWKNGSVYFYGYKADNPADDQGDSDDFDSEEEEEELPLPVANGKPEAKKEEKKVVVPKKDVNAKSSAGKQKVKIVEPEKESDDDSDDSDAMSEDSDDDEDEDSSDDEVDSDEEEETPKKEESGKKRQNESGSKTPTDKKKAKVAVTPQKTEGKKGGAVHIATPHPSKQAQAKTPAGGSKSNQKSPASEGAHSCKSCNRNFKTEGALSSHNQAKHTASK